MIPPVATSYTPPSCSFFPQERKLLNYAANVPKIEPETRAIPQASREPIRWSTSYGSFQERTVNKAEMIPKKIPESGKY